MEQSVLNEEHVCFCKISIVCPGLFEQLGPTQQYHKLCRAESKTDIMLSKVSVAKYHRHSALTRRAKLASFRPFWL